MIEAWQFSLSGNSGTRSEKKSLFCGAQKRQNPPRVKSWEIIADNLSKAGRSCGCVSALDSNGRTLWIADHNRGDGKRFIVHADQRLPAFLELESATCPLRRIILTSWPTFRQTRRR